MQSTNDPPHQTNTRLDQIDTLLSQIDRILTEMPNLLETILLTMHQTEQQEHHTIANTPFTYPAAYRNTLTTPCTKLYTTTEKLTTPCTCSICNTPYIHWQLDRHNDNTTFYACESHLTDVAETNIQPDHKTRYTLTPLTHQPPTKEPCPTGTKAPPANGAN